jgi:hypothetical protein
MVLMVPIIGYTNPAPTEARTSRTWRVKSLGTPFTFGSALRLAQILKPSVPYYIYYINVTLNHYTKLNQYT